MRIDFPPPSHGMLRTSPLLQEHRPPIAVGPIRALLLRSTSHHSTRDWGSQICLYNPNCPLTLPHMDLLRESLAASAESNFRRLTNSVCLPSLLKTARPRELSAHFL